jgi:hypothetical protein
VGALHLWQQQQQQWWVLHWESAAVTSLLLLPLMLNCWQRGHQHSGGGMTRIGGFIGRRQLLLGMGVAAAAAAAALVHAAAVVIDVACSQIQQAHCYWWRLHWWQQ